MSSAALHLHQPNYIVWCTDQRTISNGLCTNPPCSVADADASHRRRPTRPIASSSLPPATILISGGSRNRRPPATLGFRPPRPPPAFRHLLHHPLNLPPTPDFLVAFSSSSMSDVRRRKNSTWIHLQRLKRAFCASLVRTRACDF